MFPHLFPTQPCLLYVTPCLPLAPSFFSIFPKHGYSFMYLFHEHSLVDSMVAVLVRLSGFFLALFRMLWGQCIPRLLLAILGLTLSTNTQHWVSRSSHTCVFVCPFSSMLSMWTCLCVCACIASCKCSCVQCMTCIIFVCIVLWLHVYCMHVNTHVDACMCEACVGRCIY